MPATSASKRGIHADESFDQQHGERALAPSRISVARARPLRPVRSTLVRADVARPMVRMSPRTAARVSTRPRIEPKQIADHNGNGVSPRGSVLDHCVKRSIGIPAQRDPSAPCSAGGRGQTSFRRRTAASPAGRQSECVMDIKAIFPRFRGAFGFRLSLAAAMAQNTVRPSTMVRRTRSLHAGGRRRGEFLDLD